MCGIAGILEYPGTRTDEGVIRSMSSVLSHRGPDDEGYWVHGRMGLGHRRLAIIDLSEHGRQPMQNEDATIYMVANGEIYNYTEIKAELRAKGHHFKGHSDCEVITHAYEEFGERFVERLDGMFAIALWDATKEVLLLYRDRLGIKPLYYHDQAGRVSFASEPKALLRDPHYTPAVSYEGLHSFLSLSYTPGKHTMFEGIHKILPGHYLKIEAGVVQEKEYWNLVSDDSVRMDEEEALEVIDDALQHAVSRHLMSDVPMGVFLSSGLDSSLVAHYANKASTAPLTSFTMGFSEKGYSELDEAQAIAAHLGMPNKNKVVTPDVTGILRNIVWHLDDLVPAHFPSYYLNKEVKRHFTVALSGDGGDESFGGYLTYQADMVHRYTRFIPNFMNSIAGTCAGMLLPATDSKVSMEYMLKRFIAGNSESMARGHGWWNGMFSEKEKSALYTPQVSAHVKGIDAFAPFQHYYDTLPTDDILKKLMYIDLKMIMPHNYLTVSDRLSMAHSVEVRPPLLDHNFVQLLFNIPGSVKMGKMGFKRKQLMRKLAHQKFPQHLVAGKKQGFSAPINPWMRTIFKSLIDSELNEKRIQELGFFEHRTVASLVKRHDEYKENVGYHLWNLINFSLWHRLFIEQEPL